jgi:[phosphatase 2A protein]-leucine-carboxy methyltransferase
MIRTLYTLQGQIRDLRDSNPSSTEVRCTFTCLAYLTRAGTYVRTTAIDLLVKSFVSQNPEEEKQIISLGSGSDPRYFQLVAENPSLRLIYHEIDLLENAELKVSRVTQIDALRNIWQQHIKADPKYELAPDHSSLYSCGLNIHSLDLRTLATSPDPPQLPNIKPDIPTLILSECCLCYLSPTVTSSILATLTTKLLSPSTPCALILYEPILPNDAFGKRMVSNLQLRGISMPTVEAYPTLAAQRARLLNAGFITLQGASDCAFIWQRWLAPEEKRRAMRCEMLDELEEWELLAGHYCVAWGARDDNGIFNRAWSWAKSQN